MIRKIGSPQIITKSVHLENGIHGKKSRSEKSKETKEKRHPVRDALFAVAS
jgi:hypothetical protein